MTTERDRDRNERGRAQQARPRDELGRPLPYDAQGVEPVSEVALPPIEALRFAEQLLHEGRPFSAHEVLEARWKDCPLEERALWQGLAQLCVGLTHAARGNSVGAARLVDRGTERLLEYGNTDRPTYGLKLDRVVDCARRRLHGAGDA